MAAAFEIVIREDFANPQPADFSRPSPAQPAPPVPLGQGMPEPYQLEQTRRAWEQWAKQPPLPPPPPALPPVPVAGEGPPEARGGTYGVQGAPGAAGTYGVGPDVAPARETAPQTLPDRYEVQPAAEGYPVADGLPVTAPAASTPRESYDLAREAPPAERFPAPQRFYGPPTEEMLREGMPAPAPVPEPPAEVEGAIPGTLGETGAPAAPAPRARVGRPTEGYADSDAYERGQSYEDFNLNEGPEVAVESPGTEFDLGKVPQVGEKEDLGEKERRQATDEATEALRRFKEATEESTRASDHDREVKKAAVEQDPDKAREMYGKAAEEFMSPEQAARYRLEDQDRAAQKKADAAAREEEIQAKMKEGLPVAEKAPAEGGSGMGGVQQILGQLGMGGAGKMAGALGELTGGAGAAGAAGEAAGMAGGGGMLAAAGPVGAALMVAEVASKKIAGTFDSARESLELFSHVTQDAARNDYLGAFGKVVDSATSSLEEIPIVGKVWASELKLAAAPVREFADVTKAFVERGRELSRYSGDLAGATATADVRSLMRDIGEANTMGPELSKLIDAQSQFDVQFREMMEPIKAFVVGILAEVMEGLAGMMTGLNLMIRTGSETIPELLRGILGVLSEIAQAHPKAAAQKVRDTLDKIKAIMERAEDKALDGPEALLDAVKQLAGGGAEAALPAAAPWWAGRAGAAPPLVGGF